MERFVATTKATHRNSRPFLVKVSPAFVRL